MADLSPPAAPELRHIQLADESAFDLHVLRASNELAIKVLPNGCIYAIECGQILINQLLASPLAGGIHRIYLRAHDGGEVRFMEIVGPRATSVFAPAADRMVWSGSWQGLHYRCTCWLHPAGSGWFFHVDVENRTNQPVRCDAVMVQDIGLATRGQVRNNELFTSQYLDHWAMPHPQAGYLLMTRQNLPQPGDTHPWLLQGCFPGAKGFCTDGFDFFGIECRGDAAPAALARPVIGQCVRQYEAAYTAIQSNDVELAPSTSGCWSFFASFVSDHPEPSSPVDAQRLRSLEAMRQEMISALSAAGEPVPVKRVSSAFQTCKLYCADDFDGKDLDTHFPGTRRHEESQDGRLLSFFHAEDSRHVVLKAKELSVARPHGHIMRTGRRFLPDAELMSCACYAAGGFISQLTLGNTSLAKLLSAMRDPLNLVPCKGLRIFLRHDPAGPWQLLMAPSAFEMARDQCRWYYKRGEDLLTVSCIVSDDDPAITFDVQITGRPLELLISGEIAAGPAEYDYSPRLSIDRRRARISVRPDQNSLLGKKQPNIIFHVVTSSPDALEALGGDELLFADRKSRRLPYFAIQTRPTGAFTSTFLGTADASGEADALCAKYESNAGPRWRPAGAASSFWNGIVAATRLRLPNHQQAEQIQDALEWFARDALIHLSAPRGLEQPNGGAWGVRDVCQGPVEFLLSYDHADIVADILRKVFSQQYQRRGDWPQWFMFPPFQEMQSSRCHGDNLIWPLKALCDYLEHSNDGAILQEQIPYTDDQTFQPTDRPQSLLEHTDKLLRRMRQEFLGDLCLPRYGDGDWDDTLQPADPHLPDKMVSSWTAAMMYQTLRRYAAALAHFGQRERAAAADTLAAQVQADFQRHMMPDDIVAGFAIFQGQPPRAVQYLLHPSDTRTGIHYRLIPMTRGIISGIFSPAQAQQHLELINQHLVFPDGARLMDKPTTYNGGKQRTFRRAESAAFFGREIGLQYVHAHLRWAEALAIMGRGEELWHALRVVNPIAVTDVVPNARRRQRNCYFSSSDAAFGDRYEAARDYEKLRRGQVPTDGGWRIYSSGPGIYTRLVIRNLFGLRRYFDWMEFDPVLPQEFGVATCELSHNGTCVQYQFSVRRDARRIKVNGAILPGFTQIPNPHRPGGIRVRRADFEAALTSGENLVQIEL